MIHTEKKLAQRISAEDKKDIQALLLSVHRLESQDRLFDIYESYINDKALDRRCPLCRVDIINKIRKITKHFA